MNEHNELRLLNEVKQGNEGCLASIEMKYQAVAYRILVDFMGSEKSARSLLPSVFSNLYRTILETDFEEGSDCSLESMVHRASYDVALGSVTAGFSRVSPVVELSEETEEETPF